MLKLYIQSIAVGVLSLCAIGRSLLAQQDTVEVIPPEQVGVNDAKKTVTDETPANVLSPAEWQRVDESVEKALNFLAARQQPDGSFPTLAMGQPGVTSLCIMAFMAHGHLPGDGQYGQK